MAAKHTLLYCKSHINDSNSIDSIYFEISVTQERWFMYNPNGNCSAKFSRKQHMKQWILGLFRESEFSSKLKIIQQQFNDFKAIEFKVVQLREFGILLEAFYATKI